MPWLTIPRVAPTRGTCSKYTDGLDKFRLTLAQLQAEYARRGVDAVFFFQLRNPIHNGHALLIATGVLNPARTILGIFPSPMLYGGPIEVQWHAKARMNAGCEYYIIGRDPAGMKHPNGERDMFDPWHGKAVLSMAPGLEGLEILPFRVAAYDKTIGRMAFFDPKRADDYLFISGTRTRAARACKLGVRLRLGVCAGGGAEAGKQRGVRMVVRRRHVGGGGGLVGGSIAHSQFHVVKSSNLVSRVHKSCR